MNNEKMMKKPGPKPGHAALVRAENESLRRRVLELENQLTGIKAAGGVVVAPTATALAAAAEGPLGLEEIAADIFIRRMAGMQLEAFPDGEADRPAMEAMFARVRDVAVHAATVFLADPAGDTVPPDADE